MKKHTFRNFSTVMFVAILTVLAIAAYHIGSLEARMEALEYRHERLSDFTDWSATRRERAQRQSDAVDHAGAKDMVR